MKYTVDLSKYWQVVFVVVSILVLFFLLTDISGVRIGQQNFQLEEAETLEKKEKGLSNRESLAQNEGMIFRSDSNEEMCMWMKDMKFNISIIWVDSGKVVYIEPEVSMNSYPKTYCHRADYVIEVNVDDFTHSGLNVGDKLSL